MLAKWTSSAMNDLNPAEFSGIRPPYMDFYGYWVPDDYVVEAIYRSHGDFMQGSLLAVLLGSISLSGWDA